MLVRLSADLRHQHLGGVIEEVVVHPVVPPADPDHFLEQLPPQDFSWGVGGAGLMQHTCGVVCVGEGNHQLKVCSTQVYQTHLIQRAAGIDPVEDGGGCDQGDVPLLDDQVLVGHVHFPRGVHGGVDNLSTSRPFHQVVPAEVPHPPGEAQVTIVKIDHSAVAEAHRLRSLPGRRHLGDDDPDDEGVDEAADDVLYGDDDDGDHAVLGHPSEAVPDGGLSFEREEESCGEATHLVHAGVVRLVFDVAVSEGDDPEEDAKEEPRQDVGEGKDQEHHPPSDLNQGGEDVGHKEQPLLWNMAEDDVTVAVFTYVAILLTLTAIFSPNTDLIRRAHRFILLLHFPEPVGKNINNI